MLYYFLFVLDATLSFFPNQLLDSTNLDDNSSATCVSFTDTAPWYNEIKTEFHTVPFHSITFHVDVNEAICEDIKMWFPLTHDPNYSHECESGTVQTTKSSRICSYSCQCQKYHGSGSGCNIFTLHMMKMGSVCDISVHSFTFS